MNKFNFNNLGNNPEWKIINEIYNDNQQVIDLLIESFSKKYHFQKNDVKNSFLYEIMSYQYDKNKLNIFKNKLSIKYILIYMLIMIAFVLFLPISLLIYKVTKTKKYDILYEEMWDKNSLYKRFYSYIDKQLDKGFNRAVLFTSMSSKKFYNKNNIALWDGETLDIRYRNISLDYHTILKVLLKDSCYILTLYRLSQKNNINIVYLYLSILRRYVIYSSQILKISSQILISATDYYWNPLKYLCYKKNIREIMLIQHNNKDNYLFGRLFPYCDYYFAHSKDALSKINGIEFAQMYSIGSLQLTPFLDKKEISYDILFINQTVYDRALKENTPNLNVDRLRKQHERLIKNFKSYVLKNRDLKVLYVCKPTYLERKPASFVKEDFKNIPNIRFVEAYGKEMFEYVSSSKLLINMYSSVGREAYGLDKRVLWINYEHCCDLFEFDTSMEDLHVMINDNTYCAFEAKIDLLLSKSHEVDKHYEGLKEQYMNIKENPAKIVADKIAVLLTKK